MAVESMDHLNVKNYAFADCLQLHIGDVVFNGLKSSGFALYITSENGDDIQIDDRSLFVDR